jgi:D-tyrosyl-tRNA(Tyr) deacylase
MRVLLQRVSEASVQVEQKVVGAISHGLLVLVGVENVDTTEDVVWLANKITQLRIFNDANGVMNCNVNEVQGEILVVSQFTLHASTKKGNRPSYIRASKPDFAIPMYELLVQELQKNMLKPIQTGVFGADMKVSLVNDGPVTIWMDTKQKE